MKLIVYQNQTSKQMYRLKISCLFAALTVLCAAWLQNLPDPPTPIQETTAYSVDRSLPTEETTTAVVPSADTNAAEIPQVTQTAAVSETVAPYSYHDAIPLSEELQEYTAALCAQYEVPYALALAIIEHESNFDINATHINPNGTEDSGLMQLNDIVKEQVKTDYAVTDLMDPKQNLLAGIGILSDYLSRHSVSDAVMAYINGENGMKRLKAAGITTTESTDEVLVLMEKYAELL